MSISPTSDIILEVAQAADPSRARVASEKLTDPGTAGTPSDFASVLATANASRTDPRNVIARLGTEPAGSRATVPARTKAYGALEALVLQKLVETMLPKDSGAVFGGGTAGDVWRSMLAEELAKSLGKSVHLGIGGGHSPASGPRRAAVEGSRAPSHFLPEQFLPEQKV